MKAFVFFVLYFLAASIIAALVAFPLFQLVGNDTYRFESWLTRSALLFLVLGIIPCTKYFNVPLRSIGHNTSLKKFFKQSGIGFVIGLGILGAVVTLLIVFDIRTLSTDTFISTKLVAKALIAGLVVALIEETLFRGLFFKLSKSWHNATVAVFISSFFYAILHFIKPVEHVDQNQLSISSGFEVVFNAFSGLTHMQPDDFFALFSVGVLLALVRLQTQTLSYCIGLHASWVFLIKVFKDISDDNKLSSAAYLTGQYDGIVGWLSFTLITLVSIVFFLRYIKKSEVAS